MAKIAGGFADGILTSVVRAWDAWGELDSDLTAEEGEAGVNGVPRRRQMKRIIVAPAMNTAYAFSPFPPVESYANQLLDRMWRHPITKKQIAVLEDEWGVHSKSSAFAGDQRTAVDTEDESQQSEKRKAEGEGQGGGWFEVLRPIQKTLACGDAGTGAMMDWKDIVAVIEDRLGLNE